MIARRRLDGGAIRPKKSPCTTAAIAAGRWSRVSSTMPAQNGTSPRGIGRVSARSPSTVNGQEARGEHQRRRRRRSRPRRALSSTGISTISPRTRSGARSATSRETLAPSEVPPTTACVGAEVVEQRDHLLGERGHRVDQRVGRPVGAAVAEQVEGDHVQALGGQRAGQRLLHPARHQLAVQQHHPAVAGAVLGVLEPVAAAGVDEELPDPLGDQHAPARRVPAHEPRKPAARNAPTSARAGVVPELAR